MTRPLTRRSFLALAAGAGAAACSGPLSSSSSSSSAPPVTAGTTAPPELPPVPPLDGPPFGLGVASGDPLPDRVVLWTRLAPDPVAGGGMPDAPAPVLWEVATDERFADVVSRGAHVAEPRWGHSVHVDAVGLRPDSWYFYRFRVGDHVSPVGRARTAPAPGAANGALRFGFSSCQRWTDGHYSAYPHLIDEDLDLFVWLGDFIYEGGTSSGTVRRYPSGPATTLADYRGRYGLYLADPQLQAARAAMPWAVLWDDHEVADNYEGATPDRRTAAYQAWWEHQPVRLDPPTGPALRIHRTLDWGTLARFHVLDERQYRSPRACPDKESGVGDCPERTAADRTMLGDEQRAWLLDALDRTPAMWNVLANEVVLSTFRLVGQYNLDQWDGYGAERRLLVDHLAAHPERNPLVITGDIHAFAACDVQAEPGSPAVATEVVGGSISSSFSLNRSVAGLLSGLSGVHLLDGTRRGYAVADLDRSQATVRLRAVHSVMQPTSTIDTLATIEVEAGRPGGHVT